MEVLHGKISSFLFVAVGMLSPEIFDVGLFPLLGGWFDSIIK